MQKASLVLCPVLLALTSCAGDERTRPVPVEVIATLDSGGVELTIDAEGALVLSKAGAILIAVARDGFALGRVPMVRDDLSYDPYHLLVPSALYLPPEGLEFETPSGVTLLSSSGNAARVRYAFPGGASVLEVHTDATGRFDFTFTPERSDVVFFRISPRVGSGEGLYGLGESFDGVDQRGKIKGMQLELDPSTESSNNEAHVPIPMLLGTNGWGLFVEDRHPAVFDVANRRPNVVEATIGTGVDSRKGLRFHLFGADAPLDLLHHYYDLTGYPKLPARWGLGPIVWRDESVDQAQVENDLETMRALDLPATAIWLDRPYATEVNTFDFDPAMFDDPDHMIARAHELGFRVGVWHVPYLDEKSPATAALRDEANALAVFPPVHGVPLNNWGIPLDFTNPAAVSFWQNQLRAYTDHGIEGFKLDYGEDVVPGLTEARNAWSFADGSDERTMHGRYQLFYHSTYADLLPASGGFLLCRHATYGDQVNGTIVWPGDLDASFATMGEPAEDGSYVSVGGLPASLIGGLSLGVSGFPFYGSDTGGYRHSPPDKELFIRWFEQTALSPVMEIGNGASTVAWELDAATGFDAEMLDLYRNYTRLHLRLFPYEWTYANRLLDDGRPIVRPLGFVHPELGTHPDDEYMFGDDLLVAPVLARGQVSRDVVFPAGEWIDWWTGALIDGGTTLTVDAPLGTLPLYLRAGAIIPMYRPTIDTTSPTSDPGEVDSSAVDPGLVHVRAVAHGRGDFTMYDGSRFTTDASGEDVVVATVESGTELDRGGILEIVAWGDAPPANVLVDGGLAARLDDPTGLDEVDGGSAFGAETGGTVYVRFPPGIHAIEIHRSP